MDMMNATAVNFHLTKYCNARCKFCFATFEDIKSTISLADQCQMIDRLFEAGFTKINFAGGEPTLDKNLGKLIKYAKQLGFTTSIVTNGFRLEELIKDYSSFLDWVALSIDSMNENTLIELGRNPHKNPLVPQIIGLSKLCRSKGIRLKINTVVNRLNYSEDMSTLLKEIKPERWKIFQVLKVDGQNDGKVEDLLITEEQFNLFLKVHEFLDQDGIVLVPEDNDAMTDSYAMIDPTGCFFGNSNQTYIKSESILKVGVQVALEQVHFSASKFVNRGGNYQWESV